MYRLLIQVTYPLNFIFNLIILDRYKTKVIIFLSRGDSNRVIAVDQSKKSDTQPLKLLPPPNSVKPDAMAPAVKPKYRTPTSTFTSSTCTVSSSTQTTDTKTARIFKDI